MMMVVVASAAARCDAPPVQVETGLKYQVDPQNGRAFLASRRERANAVIARAKEWLSRIDVDPVDLRRRGFKGKKHFVEALDTYAWQLRFADVRERPHVLARAQPLVNHASRPEYHDMTGNPEEAFRQDATSYLRAAYLLEKLGVDTTAYRAEMHKVLPRLNAHLGSRGVHQRMAFRWYYRHFGWPYPASMEAKDTEGVIATRRSPYEMKVGDVYDLTHEIFVPFDFGHQPQLNPFFDEDRAYLLRALVPVTAVQISKRNSDTTAELVTCLALLRLTHLPVFEDAVDFLLSAQNADGSFGDYSRYEDSDGAATPVTRYLHNVVVVLDALLFAFQAPP
ncbi:MAG: hypothetical protein HY904_18175 [Deltaproteobacteria bacterium]|nr:hypothetical protein [Deltaproteobacteria bacterium]